MIRRFLSLVVLTAAPVAVMPASASAGTYNVPACFDDRPNRSWQAFSFSAYTHAYAPCPSSETSVGGHPNEGMSASNTLGPGLAPAFSHARVFFDAPPGARITRVTGEFKLNGTGGWMAGLHDESANEWFFCCTTLNTWQFLNIGRAAHRVALLVICGQGGGCSRDQFHGYAAMRNIVVTIEDNSPPSVVITGGGLATDGWRNLEQDLVVDRSDPVGIRSTRVLIDGHTLLTNNHPCDETRAAPCGNIGGSITLDTRTIGDGQHTLRVEAVDSAGNPAAVERLIAVDNHAPAPPLGLSVSDGSGWRSRPTFTLRWGNPAQSAAPVASAMLQLCVTGAASECQPAQALGSVTSAVVTVPRAGEWRARIWLRDAAGNENPGDPAEVMLRVDDKAPTLAFERPSPDRPALVRVTAADEGSGLATREVLVRRRGSSAWISLPVSIQPGGFGATIDDERLPRGVYELRARAVDLAGNERSTDLLADGNKAELALPLRVKTTLRVGRPTRVRARGAHGRRRYRIKLVERPRARYGRTIPLRGRLTTPGGNPLVDRDVQIYERAKLHATPWRLIATVRTTRTGRFTFKALRGPSRTLRFRFAGSDTIRGRSAEVRLGVRASTTFRASRLHVVNGEDVTFRGRLRSRPLPATGKLVELQAYARGRWLTFKTVRASSRTGRWSHAYRFSATRGSVRYRFRARVPREAGYPFEAGASRRVAVSVRGL